MKGNATDIENFADDEIITLNTVHKHPCIPEVDVNVLPLRLMPISGWDRWAVGVTIPAQCESTSITFVSITWINTAKIEGERNDHGRGTVH